MATDLNSVTLIGRLTNAPQLKYLPNGNAAAEFTIANNYFVPNKDNEANFFDIVAYGKIAENASKYLVKGKQVAIVGTLRQDRWQDKDTGSTRSRVRIIMQNMQMLSSGTGNNASSENTQVAPATSTQSSVSEYQSGPQAVDVSSFSDDDDVPF